MRRILIDLSQFCSWPARTGIQRVLCEMLANWPNEAVAADVGAQMGGTYRIVNLDAASSCLREMFGADLTGERTTGLRHSIESFMVARTEKSMSSDELLREYDGYFLPEPTFRDDFLAGLGKWLDSRAGDTFALLYDALPQTNPEVFAAPHQLATSRYFRLVARCENVACISRATQHCLEQRLHRRPAPNSIALSLGADSMVHRGPRRAPETPTFLMLGTVEPRKHHRAVLGAFDRLWHAGHDYRLTILGNAGWHDPEFLTDLRARASKGDKLTWLESATDAEISIATASATATIYMSELEGYGLPAVEALAAGCPLIASGALPALAELPASGQVRLQSVTVETIMVAVEDLAQPARNRQMSAAARELRLPTWRQFTRSLADWVDKTLAHA